MGANPGSGLDLLLKEICSWFEAPHPGSRFPWVAQPGHRWEFSSPRGSGTLAQPWNVGLWGRRLPVPTPTQKIPFTSSPQGWSWPSSILMPSAGPQATPSHFFLIPPLLAWWKERQSPARKPLPAPAPSSACSCRGSGAPRVTRP